jgi:hypothetical protein
LAAVESRTRTARGRKAPREPPAHSGPVQATACERLKWGSIKDTCKSRQQCQVFSPWVELVIGRASCLIGPVGCSRLGHLRHPQAILARPSDGADGVCIEHFHGWKGVPRPRGPTREIEHSRYCRSSRPSHHQRQPLSIQARQIHRRWTWLRLIFLHVSLMNPVLCPKPVLRIPLVLRPVPSGHPSQRDSHRRRGAIPSIGLCRLELRL